MLHEYYLFAFSRDLALMASTSLKGDFTEAKARLEKDLELIGAFLEEICEESENLQKNHDVTRASQIRLNIPIENF